IRVATKYPRVTEQHFARRGLQVELVKLSGNIELAPLIGLADQVVDITATGRTLKENHLRIVDDVLESTARFVANPVSLKTNSDRVTGLASALAAAAATD
ncbi:MAG: ATP phosphoribosyltransferase, partial [Actinomycetota bacterium]